jgi:hypothetical protein
MFAVDQIMRLLARVPAGFQCVELLSMSDPPSSYGG